MWLLEAQATGARDVLLIPPVLLEKSVRRKSQPPRLRIHDTPAGLRSPCPGLDAVG